VSLPKASLSYKDKIKGVHCGCDAFLFFIPIQDQYSIVNFPSKIYIELVNKNSIKAFMMKLPFIMLN
jgi:hypothetical protein